MPSLIPLLLATLLLTRMLRPRHRVDFLLIWATVLPACIFFLALLASGWNQLASTTWWTIAAFVLLVLVCIPPAVNPALRQICLRRPAGIGDVLERIKRARARHGNLALLWLLGATIAIAGVLNLLVLVLAAPANVDSLAYHLTRMAYYLQHGNLDYFKANYWAITVHPKVSTVQMLYCYLASGHNERLTQLPQYAAYWVSLLAVYGIARHLGAARRGSLFAALVSGLFVITLMEANTAQNDLVLTAFVGGTLYFLLAYRESRRFRYLPLAALAFALALGVKATAMLVIPSLLVMALYYFVPWKRNPQPISRPHLGWGLAALALALCLVALPAGYLDNLTQFGSLTGPSTIGEQHSLSETPLTDLVKFGVLNSLRYGFDFGHIDGFPPYSAVRAAQRALHFIPEHVCAAVGIKLDILEGARFPFMYGQLYAANENNAYWGILGFALVWPVMWLFVFGKKREPQARVFALVAILFFFVQAFSSPYDVWRGRYFITAGLFAAPPLAFVYLPRARWARVYLTLVVMLGCLSALLAILYRGSGNLVAYSDQGQPIPSIFSPPPTITLKQQISWEQVKRMPRIASRMAQLTRERPFLFEGFFKFDLSIPEDAVIAVDVGNYAMEYLFFGEKLTRKLIPVRTFDRSGHPQWVPIPSGADFLILADDSRNYLPTDIPLYDWHDAGFSKKVYIRQLR
jgi:4-amino-4-deoxy-L-arabinose transferase-like glycosyltransferase